MSTALVRAVRAAERHAPSGPLTYEEQQRLLDEDGFPDWDYMPGGPSEPFEYKETDWGYLDGRLVALDYPALEVR